MDETLVPELGASPEEEASGPRPKRSRPSLVWLIVTWAQVVVGLGLAGEGGVLYADARTHAGGASWLVGVVAMLIGATLGISGLYGLYAIHARSRGPEVMVPEDLPAKREPSIPMLGALLVYKYGVLTEEQLELALEQQRQEGENRRLLGGILLDMGLISAAELREALEYQHSLAHKAQAEGGEGDAEHVEKAKALAGVGEGRLPGEGGDEPCEGELG
jgi:hypothetical protein